MATLRDIRQRINSVQSTQQITRAMKMVAGAKMRRVQSQLATGRIYAAEMLAIVATAARAHADHPLLQSRKGGKVCYVLITGDRGLCGSFNANLIRAAEEELQKPRAQTPSLITIGRKGYEHFYRMKFPLAGHYVDFFSRLNYKFAADITKALIDRLLTKEFARILVIYNEFHSLARQKVVVRPFLPLCFPGKSLEARADYLFEPKPSAAAETIAPDAAAALMFRMLLESFTAEQAARMAAMEQASKNAEEMIRELVLFYNKARQAAITKELSEIIGCAEALKQ